MRYYIYTLKTPVVLVPLIIIISLRYISAIPSTIQIIIAISTSSDTGAIAKNAGKDFSPNVRKLKCVVPLTVLVEDFVVRK